MEKEKTKKQMNPFWVTGFLEGEGCFHLSFNKRFYRKVKIEVRPSFSVTQCPKSLSLLTKLQEFFQCGAIRYSKRDGMYKYEVRSISDLVTKVIPHFHHYPFEGKKKDDLLSFSKACSLISTNHHLNPIYLREIVELGYQLHGLGKRKYLKEDLLKLIVS